MSEKLTINLFLEKAKAAHGGKYDYSKVVINGAAEKVTIICSEHGEFMQQANVHYNGSGCHKCANNTKIPVNDLKRQLSIIHNYKYEYLFDCYQNNKDKVEISCTVHGSFFQNISDHKAGKGCDKCAKDATGKKKRLHSEVFFDRCNQQHKFKYDYSLSIYKTAREKIKIICPEHGEFEQIAGIHLRSGCLKCGKGLTGWSRSDFIELSQTFHDGRSNIYIVEMANNCEKFFKIGISNHPVGHRFRGKSLPYRLKEILVSRNEAGVVWDAERQIKAILRKYKYKPESEFDGHTECFTHISDEVVDLLKRLNH